MKVAHIAPGSGGGFYCQNCLRDTSLVPALSRMGLDIILVPLYLPVSTESTETAPVFYGALNCWLQEKCVLFRKTPRWLDRVFDSRRVLELVARKAASTKAEGLEEMTLSVLRGEDGRQAKELDRLVAWLRDRVRPDVVHLSNALLLGLAGRIKRELGCAVVCSLQDENDWVDSMSADFTRRVWDEMASRAAEVDLFIAVSDWYGRLLAERMSIPPGRLRTVRIGVPVDEYTPSPSLPEPPVVGFLSRASWGLGLDILIEAFLILRRNGFPNLHLAVSGGQTGADSAFIAGQRLRLERAGALSDVEFVSQFDRASRVRFLQGLSVLSVPARGGEAFGMYLIEANACGVPVVQPNLGAFAEIIGETNGGLLYEPNEPEALAKAVGALLGDADRASALGRSGRRGVLEKFPIENMARETAAVYRDAVALNQTGGTD